MTQQTSGREDRVGVLVVGAGPTGLTLAIDLARRGVACHVVEATEERGVNPRCNTTSARSMEIFRRLGLADDIRRAGLLDCRLDPLPDEPAGRGDLPPRPALGGRRAGRGRPGRLDHAGAAAPDLAAVPGAHP